MQITLIGHNTVLIEAGGMKLLTDPYFKTWGNPAYRRIAPPSCSRQELKDVDLVLVSHTHWDHVDRQYFNLIGKVVPVFTSSLVEGLLKLSGAQNAVALQPWEHRKFDGLTLTVVPAIHMAPAAGFMIQIEDKTIYFAGDTYYGRFMERITREFPSIDAALLPLSTYRIPMTMTENGAIKAVKALKPKIVIPIHLGLEPRLRFMRTRKSAESFLNKVLQAGLGTRVVLLSTSVQGDKLTGSGLSKFTL
ncbi:MAG: MBL fold metallo-hydrolase [Anaerolineaceae bacterium]|nr:MBL fold metallo-hydrolase [Anaerolineaceae bacterium]